MDRQRLNELKTMSYTVYLQTPEWKSKRELVLDRDSYGCCVCGSREQLHVHHLTYERRGNEDLNDLVTLCSICHSRHHQSLTSSPNDWLSCPGDALFETFNLCVGVRAALTHAMLFALNLNGWLVLTGPSGCGKTHLVSSIAKKRRDVGDVVIAQTMDELINELRSASMNAKGPKTHLNKMREVQEVALLVIDDYGALEVHWEESMLFQILSYRYENKLPTVISSNDINLVTIDPRIHSRMKDIEFVSLDQMTKARDYRVYGNQN